MEMENNYASKGTAGTALGLSIGALGATALNGGFGNLFGGCGCNGNAGYYSRYDAEKDARIANLETEVKLRDANTYTDGKLLELYKYVDGKFACVEHELAEQHTFNAVTSSMLGCIKNDVAELMGLTERKIPYTSICPEPMARYNSWVAPAAAAATPTTTG